jgi:putative ABC transport system ATP-binding protein
VVTPLVRTSNLCKDYCLGAGVVHAISGISLNIDQGEFVAISGRSGSGKSTLMNLFGLLERPDTGQYFLNGTELAKLSGRSRTAIRNRQIGFVFQLPTFLTRSSALENVELPLVYAGIRGSERQRKAKDALDRVGLCHRQHHWPTQLSGGEQQRVAIARALVSNPALLLADEPTGALDSNTSDEILALFQELHRDGCTIIVVTHAPDVAQRASRRIKLHDGRIVEDSSALPPVCRAVSSGREQ